MAYCVAQDVINSHRNIPSSDSTYITIFIEDADTEIDLRLGSIGYTIPFSPIPTVIKLISKLKAVHWELKRVYASQVQEGVFDWIQTFEDKAEQLLKFLEKGGKFGDLAPPQTVESTTEDVHFIFDLGDVISQGYHPDDDDIRYGEDDE